jgi:flagellar hook-length control protein FliK
MNPQTQGLQVNPNLSPETEGFDFLSYLLGLQANPMEETGETGLPMAPFTDKTSSEAEEAAPLRMDRAKEASQWNPIFPGLGQSPAQEAKPATATEITEMSLKSASQDPAAKLVLPTLHRLNAEESPRSVESDSANRTPNAAEKQEAVSTALLPTAKQVVDKYSAARPQVKAMEVSNQMEVASPVKLAAAKVEMPEVERSESKQKESSSSEVETIFSRLNAPASSHVSAAAQAKPTVEAPRMEIPEVFSKVESMVHHGGGKMTVHLSPPELGQVEIHVTTRGKRVEVEMKSDNDLTKSAIEAASADLQQSLQSQDLTLSKLEVSVTREGMSFGENHNLAGRDAFSQASFQGSANHGRDERSAPSLRQQPSTPVRTAAPVYARANGATGVDIRI